MLLIKAKVIFEPNVEKAAVKLNKTILIIVFFLKPFHCTVSVTCCEFLDWTNVNIPTLSFLVKKNKNKKTSYGVYLGKCNRDTEIQYLSMLPLCHLWLFIFTSVRAATEKRKKATSLFTFIGGCRDGYGVCFFSYSQHWCLCFGPLAPTLLTI